MTGQKSFFPLFIDMNGKKVLIIGGGKVAERRIKTLVSFGSDVTVVSPDATEYIEQASSSNIIHLLRRKYQKDDIIAVNPVLVIAATNDRNINHIVMTEAENQNIFVSVADSRDECTFYFPAIAENDDYIAGLVSKDGNHTGVKRTVEKIREVIDG